MASDLQVVLDELESLSFAPEERLDLIKTALLFALPDHPGISVDRFSYHVERLGDSLLGALTQDQDIVDLSEKATALQAVFCAAEGYRAEVDPEHIRQNNDLFYVIEQRRGSDLALVIVALGALMKAGWPGAALNIEGYYVLRLDGPNGQRMMVDVAADCAALQAPDLRRIVKARAGPQAELSADYYAAISKRDLLLALQNRVKFRAIEEEDYAAALRCVVLMKAFVPDEYRLLFEEGILCARTDRLDQAEAALEAYIARAPRDRDQHEAASLLQQVRARRS